MHTILVDTSPALAPGWQEALRRAPLPGLNRALRLALPAGGEAAGAAAAQWLSPAERWLAAALGWDASRQCAPWGALAALAAGRDPDERAWGLAQPVHLALGREALSLLDPAALQLRADEAEALLAAARPLLDDAGWSLELVSPQRWLVAHPSLADVPTADAARAVARNAASWMPDASAARPWRQLMTEIQMLWQEHAVNEARQRAGLPAVNALWLHGCGVLAPGLRNPFRFAALPQAPTSWLEAAAAGLARLPASAHPHRLLVLQPGARQDAAGDALAQAAAALDAAIGQAVQEGLREHAALRLVLAGETRWLSLELRKSRRWQVWRRADAAALLDQV